MCLCYVIDPNQDILCLFSSSFYIFVNFNVSYYFEEEEIEWPKEESRR